MKELTEIVLEKNVTKGQLCNQEGQVEFEYPLIGSYA